MTSETQKPVTKSSVLSASEGGEPLQVTAPHKAVKRQKGINTVGEILLMF